MTDDTLLAFVRTQADFRTRPTLVSAKRVQVIRAAFAQANGASVVIDIGSAETLAELHATLKLALPFPSWSGLDWNAAHDVVPEVSSALSRPVLIEVRGWRSLSTRRLHLAMDTLLELDDFVTSVNDAGSRAILIYVDDNWS